MKRSDPITSVELLNTEKNNEFVGEHGIRLDLAARTSDGELLNIVLPEQIYSLESNMQKKHEDILRVLQMQDFNYRNIIYKFN